MQHRTMQCMLPRHCLSHLHRSSMLSYSSFHIFNTEEFELSTNKAIDGTICFVDSDASATLTDNIR
jgi:hypothetical protein